MKLCQPVLGVQFLKHILYIVFQKSDLKIKHIETTSNLIRINYPFSSFKLIIAFLAQTLKISTKSTAQFLSNSHLKNGTQKRKFPIWNIPISLLTARSVASNDVMLFTFL